MFAAKNLNILNKSENKLFKEPLTFMIKPKEIWKVSGPNGIGKSSLYESLIGIRNIHFGEVFFENQKLNNLRPYERIKLGIKYIAQTNSFFQHLTIKENLILIAEHLLTKEERKESIEKSIEMFSIQNFLNKMPYQLSGGQARLSELSKILIGKHKLILLDEPFSSIDLVIIEKLIEILVSLKNQNLSFLISDHNNEILEKITNYNIILSLRNTKIIENNIP